MRRFFAYSALLLRQSKTKASSLLLCHSGVIFFHSNFMTYYVRFAQHWKYITLWSFWSYTITYSKFMTQLIYSTFMSLFEAETSTFFQFCEYLRKLCFFGESLLKLKILLKCPLSWYDKVFWIDRLRKVPIKSKVC